MATTRPNNQRKVYIARAIDDRPESEIQLSGERLAQAVIDAGFMTIDPVLRFRSDQQVSVSSPDGQVESDLTYLRTSDALLVDLSIPGWVYVGCICELVYAKLWDIPSVVIVGASDIHERLWLRYHAAAIVPDLKGGIAALRSLLGDVPMDAGGA